MTSAKIITDSVVNGVRVTTLEVVFPRIVLPEFNTHRVFSRNFQSSRAIPNKRQKEYATFVPKVWRANSKGMQPKGVLDPNIAATAESIWHMAADFAIDFSEMLSSIGVAKELCNRLIDPFVYCKGTVTSTEWDNFFNLRCHPDAQYEIRVLAELMREQISKSIPQVRTIHLPYVEVHDCNVETLDDSFFTSIMCSVARCARSSYRNFEDKEPPVEDDIRLYESLVDAKPMHASPAEHQVLDPKLLPSLLGYLQSRYNKEIPLPDISLLHGNLHYGVIQYRKLLELF